MKLVIPAGGRGKRLRPHTHTKPKPLLHVAGKTVLEHIIDMVYGTIDFSEIIFITGYLKDKSETFIRKKYPHIKTTFVEQKDPLGTADAINYAKSFVQGEDVLIIYPDTIFEADLSIIKEVQQNTYRLPNIGGIFWGKEVEDYQRFGIITHDDQGIILDMVEKPQEPIGKYANIGVYYIKNPDLMFEGIKYVFDNNIKVKGEYFLTDAFRYMFNKGERIIIAPVDGWYDCGAFNTLLETNHLLLEKFHDHKSAPVNSIIIDPVFIDEDVIIENSIIGPDVSIAKGSVIKHSMVENSIVDDHATLEHVKIADSTIGSDTHVTGKSKRLNLGDSSGVEFN